MKQKQTIARLKKALNKYGPAFVAVHLGYRDTFMLHKWKSKERIPESKIEGVSALLEEL